MSTFTDTIIVPIRTVSEANAHTHWRARQKRAKEQRALARVAVICCNTATLLRLPARITLTRLAPRTLDSDNLQGALKHIRDGVADAFGVDDGDERYDWRYAQEKAKEYGVRIEIQLDDVS